MLMNGFNTCTYEMIEVFSKAFARDGTIRGYPARTIWEQATIYIVPMVKPQMELN